MVLEEVFKGIPAVESVPAVSSAAAAAVVVVGLVVKFVAVERVETPEKCFEDIKGVPGVEECRVEARVLVAVSILVPIKTVNTVGVINSFLVCFKASLSVPIF